MVDIRRFFKNTTTTLFLMPVIGLQRITVDKYGFINAYIRDKNKPEYEGNIHVLFKPESKEQILNFALSEAVRTDLLISTYDYSNIYYVFVYRLEKKWEEDYKKIIEGKYSQLSKEYKELIPDKIKVNNGKYFRFVRSLQYDILERAEAWRNALENEIGVTIDPNSELWNKWNDEKETLDINEIIKHN